MGTGKRKPKGVAENLRECAAPECREQIELPKFFCLNHWTMLPDALQQEVGEAFLEHQRERLATLLRRAQGTIEATEKGYRTSEDAVDLGTDEPEFDSSD